MGQWVCGLFRVVVYVRCGIENLSTAAIIRLDPKQGAFMKTASRVVAMPFGTSWISMCVALTKRLAFS